MTHYPITLRLLSSFDADAFIQLRRDALRHHPWIFAASPEDDLALSMPFVKEALIYRQTSVLLGAFMPQLVGTIGIQHISQTKMAHKTRLWGLYVDPSYRRVGVGSGLVMAAIDQIHHRANVYQIHLSVSERAKTAIQLYQKFGFETWGVEPNALYYAGKSVAEHHMILNLQNL